MQTYQDINPNQWDLSQPTNFSQLPDDDFLALLAKQYPPSLPLLNGQPQDFGPWYSPDNGLSYGVGGGINPQTLHPPGEPLSLPSLSPPSDDSPSPPTGPDSSGRHAEDDDMGLKRKASEEDFEEGPSSKSSTKKGSATRRKASGSGAAPTGPEETRLAKRKEQNRAAQRAFRERKEKHVKDLEDKVAALEAKNSQATSENENLRDLLSRLQGENMALKRSSFTFSMPKNGGSSSPSSSSMYSSSLSPQQPHSPYPTLPGSMTNPLDMSSLTAFDPSVLNLLDETGNAQPTATSTGSSLATNYGFGDQNKGHFAANYTTIASNPMFLSLASLFDDPTPSPPISSNNGASTSSQSMASSNSPPNMFDFDMSGLTTWPGSEIPPPDGYDDIFGSPIFSGMMGTSPSSSMQGNGNNNNNNSPGPFVQLPTSYSSNSNINLPASLSHTNHPTTTTTTTTAASNSSSSSSSSSSGSSPESQVSDSGTAASSIHDTNNCPRTKTEFRERMKNEGNSMFAPPPGSAVPGCPDGRCFEGKLQHLLGVNGQGNEIDASLMLGPMAGGKASNLLRLGLTTNDIACQPSSTSFPHTEKSDANVPVLSAWKTIIQDPHFKDADINQLCTEFSSKAKCDGSKVVLEPQGVNQVLNSLTTKQKSQAAGGGGLGGGRTQGGGIGGGLGLGGMFGLHHQS